MDTIAREISLPGVTVDDAISHITHVLVGIGKSGPMPHSRSANMEAPGMRLRCKKCDFGMSITPTTEGCHIKWRKGHERGEHQQTCLPRFDLSFGAPREILEVISPHLKKTTQTQKDTAQAIADEITILWRRISGLELAVRIE